MILYIIGNHGYFNGTMQYPDDPEEIYGIPYGTTRKPVPEIPPGSYAVWDGKGWYLTTNPAPEIKETFYIKVNAFYDRFGDIKYDILFTEDEEIRGYIDKTRQLVYIDLTNERLIQSVNQLIEKGFVFDIDAVLSLNISENERYRE